MATTAFEAIPTPPPEGGEIRGGARVHHRGALLVIFAIGLIDFWLSRFVLFSDGLSYLEIARKYVAGDWNAAVNAYWSPLYSWVLAAARILTAKNDAWELPSMHFVNFLAYLAGFFVFERLYAKVVSRLSLTENIQQAGLRLCAYCLFLWATIRMVGTAYYSPDMIVLVVFVVLAVLLMELNRNPGDYLKLSATGGVLALGYFAKAAMLPLAFVYAAVVLARRSPAPVLLKRAAALLVPFLLLSAIWIVVLHQKYGFWTFGESGKLNYAWEVSGAARTAHWQGEPGDIGTPAHPTRHIFSHPDLYEFGSPIDATYPPWYDPTYWYSGVKPRLKLRAQLAVIAISLRWVLALLLYAPGCLALILGIVFSARNGGWSGRLRSLWFLLVPCAASILMYCLVYVDKRYIAGPALVIGLVVLCSLFPDVEKPQWRTLAKAAAVGACVLSFGVGLGWRLVRNVVWLDYPSKFNQYAIVANEMRSLGLRPGDKVAYIGVGPNAYWALLDGARVTMEIPVVFRRNAKFDNHVLDDYGNIHAFWYADSGTKEKIFALMKASGIRVVFTDVLPLDADTKGWRMLKGQLYTQFGIGNVFVRFL